MLLTICVACRHGFHDGHVDVIQAPPPGVLGGSSCYCEGECLDGRYVSDQLPNIKRHIQELWFKEHGPFIPANIELGYN